MITRVRQISVIAVALAGLLVTASCGSAHPTALHVTHYRLPRFTDPKQLVIAADGSLWMTDLYAGVSRLDRAGRIRTWFGMSDETAADMVSGPGGTVWFAAYAEVGRIDRVGRVKAWKVDRSGTVYGITAAGNAVWIANDGGLGNRPSIERLRLDGTVVSRVIIHPPGRWLAFDSLTAATNGTLWFAWDSSRATGIGQVMPSGRYSLWPLPKRLGKVGRITVGPDDALWFTEPDHHAIGRITTTGQTASYPLGEWLAPNGITSAGGALWFDANPCLGRITTSGRVTLWGVAGAQDLFGIAASAGGGFWLSDDIKNTIWRTDRPTTPIAPSSLCRPPSITRSSTGTRATLTYRRTQLFKGVDEFTDARISIVRDGHLRYSSAVPPYKPKALSTTVEGSTASFQVRDLDGDGAPEVMLTLDWGGAHCCSWTRLYRYMPGRKTYEGVNHFWGDDDAAPLLRDLNHNGRIELVSDDDRFAYDFAGYAASVRPIQIWSYTSGRFMDVTRRYPALIRANAARIWRLYLTTRGKKSDIRGVLPAWAADEYMLGHRQLVSRALSTALTQGYLTASDGTQAGRSYIRALYALLRKTGYLRTH